MNRQELQKKVHSTVHQMIGEKEGNVRFSKSGDSQVVRHYSTHYKKPQEVERVKLNPLVEEINQPQDRDEI